MPFLFLWRDVPKHSSKSLIKILCYKNLAIVLLAICVISPWYGCFGTTLLSDGTSVSVGANSFGILRRGNQLHYQGEGYIIPERWKLRRRNYGTEELVELLIRAARHVNRVVPRSVLGVADLSPLGGGSTPEHRSHQNGRDVDLLYYATDLDGNPLPPVEMFYYDSKGKSLPLTAPSLGKPSATFNNSPIDAGPNTSIDASPKNYAEHPPRLFDVKRNWAFIRAIVLDPRVPVQWIFVGRPLTDLMINYARRAGEPVYIIERALALVHQPSDSASHMDHIHLRIFCSPSDRQYGCKDIGPGRWLKKDLKYLNSPDPAGFPLAEVFPRKISTMPSFFIKFANLNAILK